MKLYLVRHADAAIVQPDMQRPLSEKGQREARRMSRFLSDNDILVDQIYHSGKLRAEQTAVTLAAGLITKVTIDVLPGLLPDDPSKPIAVYCNHWQQDTMIVGHLPFLSKLVSELILDRDNKQIVNFQTCSIICLERIAIFHWCINWFIYPSLLLKN